jgi:hypothetical protein
MARIQLRSAFYELDRRQIQWSFFRATPITIVVGLLTFICYAFHLNFATVSCFYLIAVVVQALIGETLFLRSWFHLFVSFV